MSVELKQSELLPEEVEHLSARQEEEARGNRSAWPFLMVVDDGGRPYLNEAGQERIIPLENYELMRDLAQDFQTCIPVAYTFRYLDYENVSGLGGAIPYAKELVAFMKENREFLPIHHHGLSHGYDYETGNWKWTATHAEFYNLDEGSPIPEEQQARHLELCERICQSLGIADIKTFVPPCHAWEPGVTDRLLAQYGIETLITVPDYRFGSHRYQHQSSSFLEILPRKSLGIHHRMTEDALDQQQLKRTLNEVLPMPIKTRLRYYRRVTNPWLHSYYLHVTNFYPKTRNFWYQFFETLQNRSEIILPRNEQESFRIYRKGLRG